MNNRNTYFDFLRAIAIIMVIAIHTYKVGDSIVLRQFVNGAVPIFVAISGFFISKKEVLTKTQYFTFIQRQIPKVYVPALFFMAPLFISNITSGESFFKSMVYFVICNYSVYYFIAFIIQCYVALPLIKVSVNKYKNAGGGGW